MNIGFYIHTTADTPLNKEIYELLNNAIDNNEVEDASLFYNEVDFNPNKKKFGSFNSTDLWSFSGTLITTSLNNLILATKVINDIKLSYLYSDEKNLMLLIGATQDVPVITRSEEEQKEVYRLTGNKPHLVKTFNASEILKVNHE